MKPENCHHIFLLKSDGNCVQLIMFICRSSFGLDDQKFQNELLSSNVSDPGQVLFFTRPHIWFPFVLYLKVLTYMVCMTWIDCKSYLWCRRGNFYSFWHHLRAQGRLFIFPDWSFVLILLVLLDVSTNTFCLADDKTGNSCFTYKVSSAFSSSSSF